MSANIKLILILVVPSAIGFLLTSQLKLDEKYFYGPVYLAPILMVPLAAEFIFKVLRHKRDPSKPIVLNHLTSWLGIIGVILCSLVMGAAFGV